jgi:hypothetical protein
MTISFWINDPTILLNKEYIFDLWPTSKMIYEEKLNAITRLIILISILGYILTTSIKIIFVGIITLIIIFALYKIKKQKLTKQILDEGFTINGNDISNLVDKPKTVTTDKLNSILNSEFKEGTKRNPFSNVLLTDIMDNPERKSAPPAFNPDVDQQITKDIKRSVQLMNPGIKNTSKQLYGDLYEEFNLDQSNRVFFSTANTKVVNDQGAFGKYLYGDMPSAKESNPEGNVQREKDAFRYNLY